MKQIRRSVFETNSSSTHSISIYSEKLEQNKMSMTLAEWARQDNIAVKYNTILKRYHLGWSAEDILFKGV